MQTQVGMAVFLHLCLPSIADKTALCEQDVFNASKKENIHIYAYNILFGKAATSCVNIFKLITQYNYNNSLSDIL